MSGPAPRGRAERTEDEEQGPIDGDTPLPESDDIAIDADDDAPLVPDEDDDEVSRRLDDGEAWVDGEGDSLDADDDGADENADLGEESWLADDAPADEPGDDDLDIVGDSDAAADAEDGPDETEESPLEPEARVDADDLDDDVPDEPGETPSELPAFALAPPPTGAEEILQSDASTCAVCVCGTRLVVVGEGVFCVDLESGGGTSLHFERASDMVFSSIIAPTTRLLVAATITGRVLRSTDGGTHWEPVGSLAADDGTDARVQLVADSQIDEAPLWARAHGGGVFRSRDGGRTWDGPMLRRSVRCIASDGRGGVVAACDTRGELVHIDADGNAVDKSIGIAGTAECLAVRRDVWVVCVPHRPLAVSADGGKTHREAAVLEAATAAALFETDDGAVQLAASVYDDVTDRSTVVVASIAPDGALRGARRIADVSFAAPDDDDSEPRCRVSAIVPLDAAGRRLALLLARGVAIVRRDFPEE